MFLTEIARSCPLYRKKMYSDISKEIKYKHIMKKKSFVLLLIDL